MLLSRHWLLIYFLIFIKNDESNHFQMPLNQIKHAVTQPQCACEGIATYFGLKCFQTLPIETHTSKVDNNLLQRKVFLSKPQTYL